MLCFVCVYICCLDCIFKDISYTMGQRWSPDFGSEFGGVQSCVICECALVCV